MRNPVQRILGISLTAISMLTCLALQASDAPRGRELLVEVRDTPPQAQGGFDRAADNSYTVSTGSAGDRDRSGNDAGSNPGYTLATGNSSRVVHIREGERVRVDLPAVQSLQFHVPAPNGSSKSGAKGSAASTANSPASSTSTTQSTSQSSKQGPSVSGVVYFQAVSAFAARFAVHGTQVRVDLTPLAAGGVSAPFAAADGGGARPVFVTGTLGEWISLGDTEMSLPGKSLSLTAEPPAPASIWVRVTLPE